MLDKAQIAERRPILEQELIVERSPAGGIGRPVRVTRLPPAARLALRIRLDRIAGLTAAAGLALSGKINTAATAEHGGARRAALRLGPDEWLLETAPADGAALMAEVATALAGTPHALVDISHRNIGLGLSGPGAVDLLATGCPLDLDPTPFPPGAATRTLFHKAEIVLWRTGEERFELQCWRSFARYVAGLLADAAVAGA